MLYSVVIDHEAKQVDLFKSGDTFQRSALDEVVVEATVDGLDSSDTLIVYEVITDGIRYSLKTLLSRQLKQNSKTLELTD
jgi:hypothetical protein